MSPTGGTPNGPLEPEWSSEHLHREGPSSPIILSHQQLDGVKHHLRLLEDAVQSLKVRGCEADSCTGRVLYKGSESCACSERTIGFLHAFCLSQLGYRSRFLAPAAPDGQIQIVSTDQFHMRLEDLAEKVMLGKPAPSFAGKNLLQVKLQSFVHAPAGARRWGGIPRLPLLNDASPCM